MNQWGVAVRPDTEGKLWMGITIQGEGMEVTAYLCRSGNYEDVAREIHKQIMEAGRDMRKAEKEKDRKIAVGGDMNAAIREAKGREQLRKGTAGKERP